MQSNVRISVTWASAELLLMLQYLCCNNNVKSHTGFLQLNNHCQHFRLCSGDLMYGTSCQSPTKLRRSSCAHVSLTYTAPAPASSPLLLMTDRCCIKLQAQCCTSIVQWCGFKHALESVLQVLLRTLIRILSQHPALCIKLVQSQKCSLC